MINDFSKNFYFWSQGSISAYLYFHISPTFTFQMLTIVGLSILQFFKTHFFLTFTFFEYKPLWLAFLYEFSISLFHFTLDHLILFLHQPLFKLFILDFSAFLFHFSNTKPSNFAQFYHYRVELLSFPFYFKI